MLPQRQAFFIVKSGDPAAELVDPPDQIPLPVGRPGF